MTSAGTPKGKIRWREIKVGVLARLDQHRTRTGQMVTRLAQRRLVAVLGDIEALTPRLWLAALRQGIGSAPQVVWLSDGGRGVWRLFDERFSAYATGILDFYHAAQHLWEGGRWPGWMDGPARPAGGLSEPGIVCGTACLTASWQTWRTPWTWRGCPRRHGPP